MAEATYSIGLVVEAPADARTTTALVDRCLVEGIEWLDLEHLEHLRAWRGIEPGTEPSSWKHVTTLAKAHRVVPMGRFDGNPGEHDARMARRVLLLFKRNAKTALANLVDDEHREHRCLTEPTLAHLRQRGVHTGLTAFFDEIDARVVPVISGRASA